MYKKKIKKYTTICERKKNYFLYKAPWQKYVIASDCCMGSIIYISMYTIPKHNQYQPNLFSSFFFANIEKQYIVIVYET